MNSKIYEQSRRVEQEYPPITFKKVSPSPEQAKQQCYICDGLLGEAEVISVAPDGPRFEKLLHTRCFVCSACRKDISGTFYMEGRSIFCEQDYLESKNMTCDVCDTVIRTLFVDVNGRRMHEECFCCSGCRCTFTGGKQFREQDGKYYCTDCAAYQTGRICARCGGGASEALKALDKIFHKSCFTCAFCDVKLEGAFVEDGGKPFHQECLRKSQASSTKDTASENAWELIGDHKSKKCFECRKPVAYGEGVRVQSGVKSTRGTKKTYTYHPECFRCTSCKKKISGAFMSGIEGFYCPACQDKMTDMAVPLDDAPPCAACGKLLSGYTTKALGKEYHKACFKCYKCGASLEDGFIEKDGNPVCERCA